MIASLNVLAAVLALKKKRFNRSMLSSVAAFALSQTPLLQKLKTPNVKTFGVLLFGASCVLFSCVLQAECAATIAETAQLERVYDGDTIKLMDGRHVRVLGINAPEVDHGNESTGQPLGEEARAATVAFFKRNKMVKLSYDILRVDHYGRSLAHVYDAQGNSLAAYLLRMGLGFQISVPPNISSAECLRNAEVAAKRQHLGVWSNPYWRPKQASELTLMDGGFKLVQGKVLRVHQAKTVWLELDGPLAINISPTQGSYFMTQDWQRLKGKQVEVRGWITSRRETTNLHGGKAKSPRAFKSLIVHTLAEDVLVLKD